MQKKIIILVVVVLGLVALAIGYFMRSRSTTDTEVTAPEYATEAKVVVPEVNPVTKANPFTDLKTNPFE